MAGNHHGPIECYTSANRPFWRLRSGRQPLAHGDQTLAICVFAVGKFPGKKANVHIFGNKMGTSGAYHRFRDRSCPWVSAR
jgi:hypothetical protein